jgi:predicted DNA-binding transcriptional regulator YafY
MPMDRVLHAVAQRAPNGFDRIEDVLTPAELAALAEAYRHTSGAVPDGADTAARYAAGASADDCRP